MVVEINDNLVVNVGVDDIMPNIGISVFGSLKEKNQHSSKKRFSYIWIDMDSVLVTNNLKIFSTQLYILIT